ncbi:MAG: DUF1818 domain-containing protein [Phormidesmis priestleyi]|uniref:DUF1818 domain-containing protein n=1 Tax=Phormidesmis priestleyi TaxID=268141 RepID=A0A2W4Z7N2_9CYAN|nr:MAG: DUF1818 domain-containing protein [Phormidesmis priestleyi]
MIRQIKSGEGWRIGWNPANSEFCGLLSGESWSIELTAAEFADFCRGVQKLQATMAAMASELMDEERLSCEQETAALWLEAEGFPAAYSLRFILRSGRRGEGAWPAAIVPELLAAIAEPSFGQWRE